MEADPLSVLALALPLAIALGGLCLCYAISADAAARGASGFGWGLFAFVALPIAAPIYLLYRTQLPDRDQIGRRERWLGTIGIGTVTAVGISSVVSPPDPFTLLLYVPPLLIVSVPLAFVLCYEPGWRAIAAT
ncbi:hypothetical protein D8Y22_18035 [Salinadaptatus halalkaliphilus]|uniref:Uncharacterized protein n=1 Tax=Salinadaptatus halalkaliphilus TaxID=2419781 RepID=A0A4V3VL01_9EURY|nr:hypothetical protein [Salinadaptatus halalkaliphilus]THE63707.1 hypothetical protein D8Y22_18035 [Salinadaptatus halalkaliphilus]